MIVLILHGWGHERQYWEHIAHILPRYNQSIKVIALDLPGFGSEKLPPTIRTIPHYAKWLADYIKAKKLTDIVLIGHSFGGRIAAEYTAKNPKRVNKLILYAAPCIYRPTHSLKRRIMVYKAFKHIMPQKVRKLFLSADAKAIRNPDVSAVFRNIVRHDQTAKLKSITTPTLLLWGENDTMVPLAVAKEMHELMLGSTLRVMPHEGHNAHLDNPTLFAGIVYDYIKNN